MTELLNIGETVRAEEIVLRLSDGRHVTVLPNAAPIAYEEGAAESAGLTLQGVAPVEELARARAEFLAMVSHELRAPLTSIKGSAAMALDAAVDLEPAVVHQLFRIIGEQADQMHGLISDLLDVARLESGMPSVSPEPAEMAVLVERACSAFANAGGANPLQVDIEPHLPLVMADHRRIGQVLSILLNNAARNSPEDSVIRLGAVREDVHVAVFVCDHGRGFPAESLPRLFRNFSDVQFEEQGGDSALGLAICKGIIEAHGGRIWAESDGPGLGARFTFTLPTCEAVGLEALDRSPGTLAAGPRLEQREQSRILAVDDDLHVLRFVADVLTADNYEPVITGDPQEALRLVSERQPQLVLLDMELPGTDGIELMEEILKIQDVPVIFLSAYGRDELVAHAVEQGAADYVVKPFSPTELSARIKAALRRKVVSEPPPPYALGELRVDYAARRVTLSGRQIDLTPTEYRMLALLSANAGQVVTYARVLALVWGERSKGDLRAVRTMMGKLRRQLGEDVEQPRYIFTEPSVGYRMPKPEDPNDE